MQHALQPGLSPGGDEIHPVLGSRHRPLAQRLRRAGLTDQLKRFLHRDEPLLRRPENDRGLRPPIVRITVQDILCREQPPASAQLFSDQPVGFLDRLPAQKFRHRLVEPPARQYRAVDRQSVLAPRVIVILPMPRRGMHHARAIGRRHIVGGEDSSLVVDERVNVFRPLRQLLPGHRLRQHAHLFDPLPEAWTKHLVAQLRGDDADPLLPRPRILDKGVLHRRIHRDRQIRRQRPRRGRPHDQINRPIELLRHLRPPLHRELHIHARILHILVFQLRIRQRRLTRHRPRHRLELFVHQPRLDKPCEHLQRLRLILRLHRQIRIRPVPKDPQSLKLLALRLGKMLGGGIAQLPHLHRPHRPEILPRLLHLLLNLVLDRQPVTIPARHIGRLVSLHRPEAQDHILERLVDQMPDVDIPVRERRPIVQHPLALPVRRPIGEDFFVQPTLPPHRQALRLVHRQLRLHRERRLRQV